MNTKLKHLIWALLLVTAGGWAGYRSRPLEASDLVLSKEATPQVDYLIGAQSFSRIENTKTTLEGLCRRVCLEARTKLLTPKYSGSSSSQETECLASVIRALEQGMHEFEGTEQELELVQELLVTLKRAEHFDRWLDVYLKTLYEHPTHPVPLHFAQEALAVSHAVGRQGEVLAGLRHLLTIPLDFDGKDGVAALLLHITSRDQLTRFEAYSHSNQRGS
jgi:hypothetical protein